MYLILEIVKKSRRSWREELVNDLDEERLRYCVYRLLNVRVRQNC